MSSNPIPVPAPNVFSPLARRGWFLLTVFTSAFLLFLVQPMIARMALPRVGGAPSVWNSAMLVYQALLLAGYAYAHFLGRLAPRRQAMVHLGLLALAALTLPIALIDATPSAQTNSFLWVPWLLLVSIGPLFFAVSAQAPLLQRWYALAGHGDPYPLYAASNFGSFLGLLAYPLLVEPLAPVASQSLGWSVGFILVAFLVAGCATRLPAAAAAVTPAQADRPAPKSREVLRWIWLAAIPSGLIMSTTLHLTTDIVAMPLLWVLPLGLYLLSFSVAFAADRRPADLVRRVAPFALLAVACGVSADSTPFPLVMLAVALVGLFALSTAIHAILYDHRPDPVHLTRFYLAMSVGGALGGLFCALVAPMVFDWTYEHPLLLLAAAASLAAVAPFDRTAQWWGGAGRARATRLGVIAALVLLIVANSLWGGSPNEAVEFAGLVGLIALGIVAIGNRTLFVVATGALMLSTGGLEKLTLSADPGRMTRSFFGIYSIHNGPNRSRMIAHGTTSHGVQNLGSEARERMATSYYAPRSGVGLAMASVPSLFPKARVGIVGLGAGTLACSSAPGQSWRFYEIDPVIVGIAQDRSLFRFLDRCQPGAPMIVGDARLTLGQEPAGSADVLVIDAFSSDSVPMHLLTREAFAGYRRHLSKDGLLMVHISNRYLDLKPVIGAATRWGFTARSRLYHPTEAEARDNAGASLWIALSPNPATIARLEALTGTTNWLPLAATPGFNGWTDDHSTILPLIKWAS
jgi:hypothetical protein